MMLGGTAEEGGEGLSLMTFRKSEKLSYFRAHNLSSTVNKLCTRILRVPSSCPVIVYMYRWTLWKSHSAVFSSKKKEEGTNK